MEESERRVSAAESERRRGTESEFGFGFISADAFNRKRIAGKEIN